ncbi:hypothetical protein Tco_0475398 [Tanacetum coccineum]
MDPTGRRSSQLIAWSRREKQNRRKRVVFLVAPLRSMESTILIKSLRCWIGSSDIVPVKCHLFAHKPVVSDHRATLAPSGSSMALRSRRRRFMPAMLSPATIIAKVLANRLSKVVDKIASHDQSAFISGRQMLDGLHVALSDAIRPAYNDSTSRINLRQVRPSVASCWFQVCKILLLGRSLVRWCGTQQLENIRIWLGRKNLCNVDDRWAEPDGDEGLCVKVAREFWTWFYFQKRMLIQDGLSLFPFKVVHPIFSFPVTGFSLLSRLICRWLVTFLDKPVILIRAG